ncbi:MAG: hypothetical protein OSJ76_02560 [Alphaproteobacteria bacterium]|nr:hypothetical protein [Alphaproteobacteria bacterium]
MTQLSFIAIIASVLTYTIWLLSNGMLWGIAAQNTPAWKRTLWKIFRWFDLDESPLWRRRFLKLLLSALFITAFCCGFWDTYSINLENKTVWRILLCVLLTMASFFVTIGICFTAHNPENVLSNDYFNLWNWNKSSASQVKKITVINSGILFLWVIVFAGGIYLRNIEQTFAWLSLSALTTAILCFLLIMCAVLAYALYKVLYCIIIYPIWHYIKWLIK